MKRKVFGLIVAAVAVLALGGCAKKAASTTAPLVYWSMWNEVEPQGQVIARAAEAFTKETGIKVAIHFNGRDIRKTLQPALDAGEAIDLFDEDIERVSNTWGNYLLPLDSYVSQTYSTTGGKPFAPCFGNRCNSRLVEQILVVERQIRIRLIGDGLDHAAAELPCQVEQGLVYHLIEGFTPGGGICL